MFMKVLLFWISTEYSDLCIFNAQMAFPSRVLCVICLGISEILHRHCTVIDLCTICRSSRARTWAEQVEECFKECCRIMILSDIWRVWILVVQVDNVYSTKLMDDCLFSLSSLPTQQNSLALSQVCISNASLMVSVWARRENFLW